MSEKNFFKSEEYKKPGVVTIGMSVSSLQKYAYDSPGC